jgi:hypothetical protein
MSTITMVLELADRPMQARDIHTAAENLLGEAIKWSSVKAALADHSVGSHARFERVGRGRYRPRTASSPELPNNHPR